MLLAAAWRSGASRATACGGAGTRRRTMSGWRSRSTAQRSCSVRVRRPRPPPACGPAGTGCHPPAPPPDPAQLLAPDGVRLAAVAELQDGKALAGTGPVAHGVAGRARRMCRWGGFSHAAGYALRRVISAPPARPARRPNDPPGPGDGPGLGRVGGEQFSKNEVTRGIRRGDSRVS